MKPGAGMLSDLDELDEFDDFVDSEEEVVGPRVRLQGETESARLEYWTVRAQVYTTEVAAKSACLPASSD